MQAGVQKVNGRSALRVGCVGWQGVHPDNFSYREDREREEQNVSREFKI